MDLYLNRREARVRRARLGLTQADLAALLGVTGSYVSFLEAGRRPVPAERQEALARALGGKRGLFVRPEVVERG